VFGCKVLVNSLSAKGCGKLVFEFREIDSEKALLNRSKLPINRREIRPMGSGWFTVGENVSFLEELMLLCKAQVRHATKSSNFVVQLCCSTKLPRQWKRIFPSANNRQKSMASSDTGDDKIISSALLIASTFYQRRQVNVRKRKRNSWACKQTTDQSQLGDKARNCRRLETVSI